ncbi:glycoside hydrolase family 97 protein [Carboxylicivirga sp. N1Y90]|uniref:glycoside hydrolase family 97 protein n=1 Tax=Carboxylicivirga fragile TaxID=3417571 RepID=UPI003D33A11B
MKLIYLAVLITLFASCTFSKQTLISPDSNIQLNFENNEGQTMYSVIKGKEIIIQPSLLGFNFKEQGALDSKFRILGTKNKSHDEEWTAPWGPNKQIHNEYNELEVRLLHETSKIKLHLIFRVFNDGVAFRYVFPEQENLTDFVILDELSEFALADNHTSWWIEADYDTYEKLYKKTLVSEATHVNTPITMRSKSGTHISLHEAALTDYAGMTLQLKEGSNTYVSTLVPWADGTKVKASAPFKTPWRTILITDNAAQLVESNTILNLNEPCKIVDTSWIEPMKYIGIWWGMHIGTETWVEGDRHGATTENSKRYIDFAAENNIGGVVIEGWNSGWDKWGAKDAFDHVSSASDYNLEEVAAYAKTNNVDLIMHHETGGDAEGYEKLMVPAFELCQKLGIRALKTGYAGGIYPRGEHHHGQYMVRHYQKVVETAAKYGIMINAHEPIKATGKRRTWPNMMTREGVRGMEWNAWSTGNPPSHTLIIPFTRMLGGPVDYTPGTFDVMLTNFKNERVAWNTDDLSVTRVHTTLAKQLALSVILYSPLQMASDIIDNYVDHPAMKFLNDLDVDFDETKILNASIGEYITMVRRSGSTWYLGSATNEEAREIDINLDFLDAGKVYDAIIYADAETTHWETNATDYTIQTATFKKDDTLMLKLASGGGQAIVFKESRK